LTNQQHSNPLEVLLEIARDLTASLAAADRYARLLGGVRRLIPCDAACLLRLEGGDLVPVAGYGLTAAALSARYPRRDHPRLDVILNAREPVKFPVDSRLPDPFDGVIEAAPGPLHKVHACLGCALTDGGDVVGALTADALEPHQFDALDDRVVATLGALAGAALRTT
jgi:anaerobic nitric oxide reductase transcription regulator